MIKITKDGLHNAHDEKISFQTSFPVPNTIIEIFNTKTNKSKGLYYVTSELGIRDINNGKNYSSKVSSLKDLAYMYLRGDINDIYFVDKETNILYDCYNGLISGVNGKRFDNKTYFYQFKIDIEKVFDHLKILSLFKEDIVFTKKEIIHLIHQAYSEGYSECLGVSKFNGNRLKFIISLFQQKITESNKKLDVIFTLY